MRSLGEPAPTKVEASTDEEWVWGLTLTLCVAVIKDELYEGNAYQINYTLKKIYECFDSGLNTYLALRNIVKPPYGYYIKYNNCEILSFSPELFFETKKNKIFSNNLNTIKYVRKFGLRLINKSDVAKKYLMLNAMGLRNLSAPFLT